MEKCNEGRLAVQASFQAPGIHAEFFNSHKSAKKDYDLLLK
jgi:hypothetical protein